MIVLYHPDLEIDIDKALAKVEKIIKDNGGAINKLDNWGKRKLAYQIKKQDHAVYVYYELGIPGVNVSKLEQTLNITDEIIRYLIVTPGPVVEVELDEASADDESGDAKEASDDKPETEDDEEQE
jgi:small subunit ribosomal protein S6